MIVSISIISLRKLSHQNTVDYLSDLLQIFNPILHILLGQLIKWLNICFTSLNSWNISLCKPFSMLIFFFFPKKTFQANHISKKCFKKQIKKKVARIIWCLFTLIVIFHYDHREDPIHSYQEFLLGWISLYKCSTSPWLQR